MTREPKNEVWDDEELRLPTWERCRCPHCTEARAEIERLKAENAKLTEEEHVEIELLHRQIESHKHDVERLKALLRRHHLRGAYWDSDLAAETRAALEPKP